ncbi:glutathione S-transferase-like protein [Novosphingobium nitrogenifigens DSM 19370]|uniref:Glutathione S-transferase-like protein n=1 Tax=Novosphingobium nitrogenifigens DSM 19370 TaxID=983920 RepID=F1Z9R3_9SPHN|nr:glutathione S-transferase family protein [Novosphingobium nitrogenifigens]EGD58679.1 glutathione S-transferase-like protein [Novosphingobium nitrogenifigens DSM 19370]
MITIWGRLNSHNVKKVAWAAIEMGIEHRRIDMGGAFGFTDDYLAMNPNRLIPTIEDDSVPGGFSLWESNAILRYLADAHAPHLRPEAPAERAQGDKWMDWQFTFAEAQRTAFQGIVRQGKDVNDPQVSASIAATIKLAERFDAALGQTPFLAGKAFGIADIPMGVYAYTFFTLPFERPSLPNMEDWYAGLTARPGYASQVMIPLS